MSGFFSVTILATMWRGTDCLSRCRTKGNGDSLLIELDRRYKNATVKYWAKDTIIWVRVAALQLENGYRISDNGV